MVSAPSSLVWACVSRHNSFQRSKNGKTKRSGRVIFSVEKGNVASISSFKYSGIANEKAVDVVVGSNAKGACPVFVKKTVSKANKPVKALQKQNFSTSNLRKGAKSLASQNTYYRADLQSAIEAKFAGLNKGFKVAAGVSKASTCSTGRA
ncbi:hypothetical protein TrRE_jg3465 [Triparma retinervis]|uniref:Ribosomal eL28/Mak16 domain-containing protein n=1 Tax=Triparma retinervis TaxID=2557542 RepID=A0A9W7A2L3_9STRA|nr:hypothetical protein TrRE_jg3465 [Triparma retinervis]